MESNLVIKVKYSDMLRRFNASINENGRLDLDMEALRAKIFILFGFPRNTDVTLTYVDEDGDIVTLVDDNDLSDVTRQHLKFLMINVQLNNDKGAKSHARTSGSSTPMRSPRFQNPLPKFNFGDTEWLKSVPDPLRDALVPIHGALSKLSLDLASKAASASPVAAELIDHFSKVGLSCLNQAQQSQGGSVASKQAVASEVPAAPSVAKEQNASKDGGLLDIAPTSTKVMESHVTGVKNVTRGVGPSAKPVSASIDLKTNTSDCIVTESTIVDPSPATCFQPVVDGKIEAKKQKAGHPDWKPLSAATSASLSISRRPMANECPFSIIPMPNYTPIHPMVPLPIAPVKGGSLHNDDMVGFSPVFHRGVQCDGCGAHPIVGLRYKSRVRYDYDLCNICFMKMGKEADFVKIERPTTYCHPRSFKGLHEPNYWTPPSPPSNTMRLKRGMRTRSKLDSHFILDVNVLDGTAMAPSTNFTKIWRMRNSGTITWPQGTRLVWTGGDYFSNVDFVELEIPENGVAVDGELDVAVDFTSPELPGRYISYWRMASSSGTKFGQRVWVLILVNADMKDSVSEVFGGLNLNLPPNGGLPKVPELVDLNVEPVVDGGLLDESSSAEASESVIQTVDQQPEDQNLSFPLSDTLLVGHSVSASAPPEFPSPVSYPIMDFSEATLTENAQSFPPVEPVTLVEKFGVSNVENTLLKELEVMGFKQEDLNKEILRMNEYNLEQSVDDLCGVPVEPVTLVEKVGVSNVENTLLKELEVMGFKQVDLNKEILRMNEYNLEQSVDDLCGVSEWDPMLEELWEMGFHDMVMNRKLLKKNNGSIKRVVMDLLIGEKA